MALTQISTQGIKDGTITGSDLATNVDLVDNQKLRLGTGNDLQIFHTGTASKINNANVPLLFQSDAMSFHGEGGSETMAVFTKNGAVELYHDNSKKFETTANGVLTTGNIQLDSDSGKLTVGDSGDFEVYHDGSNTYLDNLTGALYIRNNVNNDENTNIYLQAKIGEEGIIIHDDGPVELYYDGARVFETDSGSVKIRDNIKANFGTGNDLQIYHDGTRSYIDSQSTQLRIETDALRLRSDSGETYLEADANGAVQIYHDNSKKFETTSDGATVTGNLFASNKFRGNDNVKLELGTGNDLQIFHDSVNNNIKGIGNHIMRFWTNNTIRWNILNDGHFRPEADNSYDIGASNQRVRSIFASNALDLADNAKVQLGNSDDLQIYHTGSHSIIRDAGTGNLQIAGSFIQFTNAAITSTGLTFAEGGAVELYFNNSLRLSTTANGVTLGHNLFLDNATNAGRDVIWDPANDQLQWKDNTKASFGNNSDLQIYHDGSHSFIEESGTGNLTIKGSSQININNAADTENCAIFKSDGAVELYFDGSKKFNTTSSGIEATGTQHKFTSGSSGDCELIIEADTDNDQEHDNPRILFRQDGGIDESAIQNSDNKLELLNSVSNGGIIFKLGTTNGYTNAVERMRIDSDGRVLIGGTSKVFNEFLSVQKGGDSTHVATFYFNNTQDQTAVIIKHDRAGNQGDGTSATMMAFLDQTNGTSGSISSNGNSTSFNTSSDYRLKENEIAISDGITRLKTLKPYRFNFKKDSTKIVDGFFAHEVQNVIPEAISGEKDQVNEDGSIKPQQIDQSKLVPLLVAALQEAIGKIELLETEVAALKAG